MSGGKKDFLKALFASEGGGNPRVINQAGFVGKYQFGEAALIDLGYYLSDGSNYRNDWRGQWTGKHGVQSLDGFRQSSDAQDAAAAEWITLLCKRARRMGLHRYYGSTIKGILVTESGVLAGAHLVGMGTKQKPDGVALFLNSDGVKDPADGNGTRASKYLQKFAGYELGCHSGKLDIALHDRHDEPLAGALYEVRKGGETIQAGTTNGQGRIKEAVELSFDDTVEFWIGRFEGGFKQIWTGAVASAEKLLLLRSPKVRVVATTRMHQGPPGSHQNRTQSARQSGVHLVSRGDSLWRIARRHGLTVAQLRSRNPSIANTDIIHPGQRLIVDSPPRAMTFREAGGGGTERDVSSSNAQQKSDAPPTAHLPSTPPSTGTFGQTAGATVGHSRTTSGAPVAVVRDSRQPIEQPSDRLKRMIEILEMNVRYGSRAAKPNGPSAVTKARHGRPISDVDKVPGKSLGWCYLYVKVALQASGMANSYLAGGHAKEAGRELRKEGFKNLLGEPGNHFSSPHDAPVGAVVVYGVTDNSPSGHIEVRLPNGFASDYFSPRCRVEKSGQKPTMTGRNRKVIGIWVKQ